MNGLLEANSHRLLCNSLVQLPCSQESTYLIQINPVHTITFYFFKIILIIPSTCAHVDTTDKNVSKFLYLFISITLIYLHFLMFFFPCFYFSPLSYNVPGIEFKYNEIYLPYTYPWDITAITELT
jgi:hypothetical protein